MSNGCRSRAGSRADPALLHGRRTHRHDAEFQAPPRMSDGRLSTSGGRSRTMGLRPIGDRQWNDRPGPSGRSVRILLSSAIAGHSGRGSRGRFRCRLQAGGAASPSPSSASPAAGASTSSTRRAASSRFGFHLAGRQRPRDAHADRWHHPCEAGCQGKWRARLLLSASRSSLSQRGEHPLGQPPVGHRDVRRRARPCQPGPVACDLTSGSREGATPNELWEWRDARIFGRGAERPRAELHRVPVESRGFGEEIADAVAGALAKEHTGAPPSPTMERADHLRSATYLVPVPRPRPWRR